jgi:hypothetical protein
MRGFCHCTFSRCHSGGSVVVLSSTIPIVALFQRSTVCLGAGPNDLDDFRLRVGPEKGTLCWQRKSVNNVGHLIEADGAAGIGIGQTIPTILGRVYETDHVRRSSGSSDLIPKLRGTIAA